MSDDHPAIMNEISQLMAIYEPLWMVVGEPAPMKHEKHESQTWDHHPMFMEESDVKPMRTYIYIYKYNTYIDICIHLYTSKSTLS